MAMAKWALMILFFLPVSLVQSVGRIVLTPALIWTAAGILGLATLWNLPGHLGNQWAQVAVAAVEVVAPVFRTAPSAP